jgi:hypothetical protein
MIIESFNGEDFRLFEDTSHNSFFRKQYGTDVGASTA